MSWKNGKKWVYSVTYDEGLAELLNTAVPLHREYGIPGHVAVVAGQIGVPRNVPRSSYDGWMILSQAEIEELRGEGWGVSCHSLTHCGVRPENVDEEVIRAKSVLEETLGIDVPMFCVPCDNGGHLPAAAVAPAAGYTSILTIYDEINTKATDLMRLARVPIHTRYPEPFYSVFDPYKRLHQAIDAGGWVIDYAHCPMPGKPHHPAKDCTTEELRERFETVLRVGGDDVWLAEPNEVVDYILKERTSPQPKVSAAI